MRSSWPWQRLLRGDFARHGLLVFAASMLVNIFNYVFHFAISRRLGVADYGDLYALFSMLTLMSVPVTSLTVVIVRYAAEFHALGDTPRLMRLADWVWHRTLLGAAAVFVVGSLLSGPIAVYLAIRDPREVIATALVLALSIVLPAVRGILQGVQDFRRYAVSTAIEAAFKAILGIGLVAAGFGVNGALIGFALATAIGIVYSLFAVRHHFSGAESAPLKVDARRLLATTTGITVAMLAMTVLGSFDTILVKHFFPAETAGLYSAVSLVGKVLFYVVSFIPTVILPKATARAISGASPAPLLLQAAFVMTGICIGGLALLAFVPGLIVAAMVGGAFVGATPYVLEYGAAMTLLGITSVVVAYKVGIHRFDFVPSLIAVTVAEIAIISVYHPNVHAIINVLIAGHACALLCTSYRVTAVAAPPRIDVAVPS